MLTELVKLIAADSGLEETEIRNKILEKQRELGGLVSEEGAAYMVAKEMGLSLLRKQERLRIQNILPGMKNVDVIGSVQRIFPVREFKTEKAAGKVLNVILADSTGSVRLSVWNDEIEKMHHIAEGDVVHVKGYAKEDNAGLPELRIGRFGILQKSEEIVEAVPVERRSERSSLAELREGRYRAVRGCLVQVFESTVFFEICPECGARLKEESDYKCPEHGDVSPDYGLVISGIIDDGTDSVRAVLFGEPAEKIIGMSRKDAKLLFDRKKTVRAVLDRISLGKDFLFEGKFRRNELFDRPEFVVNSVKDVHVRTEIELLLG